MPERLEKQDGPLPDSDPRRVAADLLKASKIMQQRAQAAMRGGDTVLAEMFAKKAWRYKEQAQSLLTLYHDRG